MKILKIKVKREQTQVGTHYTYPPEYDPYKIQVLCYESSLPENQINVVARGNKDEFLIGCVKNIDAPQFLANPDIIEITEVEALTLGNIWTKQVEKIVDQDGLLLLLAKVAKGQELTLQEQDLLNPANPNAYIQLSRSFSDVLNELKTKL